MNLLEAEQLAKRLLREFGCDKEWPFKWTRGKRELGRIGWKRNRITGEISKRHLGLSKYLVLNNSREEIEDTIRHEIAHILAGPGNGHNYKWKQMCLVTGANPNRLNHTAKMPEPAYILYCGNCKTVLGKRHRKKLKLSGKCCAYCRSDKIAWMNNPNI